MPSGKVSLCYYCKETHTRSVVYGRGKGRKPKKIARHICLAQKCWDGYYAEVAAL